MSATVCHSPGQLAQVVAMVSSHGLVPGSLMLRAHPAFSQNSRMCTRSDSLLPPEINANRESDIPPLVMIPSRAWEERRTDVDDGPGPTGMVIRKRRGLPKPHQTHIFPFPQPDTPLPLSTISSPSRPCFPRIDELLQSDDCSGSFIPTKCPWRRIPAEGACN